ncbi:MAG: class I SAM-dependent methyltransferase [candidate division WOR-3 bacterium]
MAKKYTVTETWIVNNANPVESSSSEQVYERLAKVSGRLPVIDVPQDFREESHFVDEALVRDFAAHSGGAHSILDVCCGDGWPLLRLAPLFEVVTGIDASQRRVDVCRANAERLGLKNVTVARMSAEALDFPDERFDAVVAASAIEQTQDPYAALREIYRVLKPGGRLRIHFEPYEGEKKGLTEQVYLSETADSFGYHYVIRHSRPPWERNYLVRFAVNPDTKDEFRRLGELLERVGPNPSQTPEIGIQFLERNQHQLAGASWYELEHFTSATLKETLEETGFVRVRVSWSAGTLSRSLWQRIQSSGMTDQQIQDICQGLADLALKLDAPVGLGEPVAAVKPS